MTPGERERFLSILERSNRLASLGTMATGVAHEVNNPLAVIAGDLDPIKRKLERKLGSASGGEEARGEIREPSRALLFEVLDLLEEARLATGRIVSIVADLRAFSRPAASEPNGAGAEVGEALAWAFRSTAREMKERCRLVVDASPVSPVRLDAVRLGQVLLNLLLNAAQSIEPGRVENNEVRVVTRSLEAGWATVEIGDTGAGIPPEALAHVFEPLLATQTSEKASGLGLAVCHGIIAAAGGTIDIESTVGKGTTVRLCLPTTVAEPREVPSVPPSEPLQTGRILVIDDDALILRAVTRVLRRDHSLVCLENAESALALIRGGERFDVVLCDLSMPGMTGMQFHLELGKTHPQEQRRIIFLSGGASAEDAEEFAASVPNDIFEKPFDVRELKAAIARIIRSARLQPELLQP